MRHRVRRLLGVSALYLLFGLGVSACSGQQQEDEALEVSEQGENQAAENQEAANEEAATNEQAAENETASEEGASDEQAANEDEGTDNTAEAADGTENDLQEIIQEMNGQQAETAEAAPAEALQPEPAPANMAAAPTNNAAAAPMNTAAPAQPQQQASSPLPFQPGGTPAGQGLPEMGSKMAYVVEQGDTLGKISQKIYGTPGRWKEMATLSGMTNPSRIFPGDLIYYTLDDAAVPFAAAYESIQKSEEQVQPGDTLASIAKRVYGTTTAWRSIWRHNDSIENPDVVPPGTVVFYIPKGAATAAVKKFNAELVKIAKVEKSKTDSTTKISAIKRTVNNGILLTDSQTQAKIDSTRLQI